MPESCVVGCQAQSVISRVYRLPLSKQMAPKSYITSPLYFVAMVTQFPVCPLFLRLNRNASIGDSRWFATNNSDYNKVGSWDMSYVISYWLVNICQRFGGACRHATSISHEISEYTSTIQTQMSTTSLPKRKKQIQPGQSTQHKTKPARRQSMKLMLRFICCIKIRKYTVSGKDCTFFYFFF